MQNEAGKIQKTTSCKKKKKMQIFIFKQQIQNQKTKQTILPMFFKVTKSLGGTCQRNMETKSLTKQ